jgi:hypothetical protein
METNALSKAILEYLETTEVGRKIRKEAWEEAQEGSGSSAAEKDEMAEVEEELDEVEVAGGGVRSFAFGVGQ